MDSEDQLRYAIKRGLLPKICANVLQSDTNTLEAIIRAAYTAEVALAMILDTDNDKVVMELTKSVAALVTKLAATTATTAAAASVVLQTSIISTVTSLNAADFSSSNRGRKTADPARTHITTLTAVFDSSSIGGR